MLPKKYEDGLFMYTTIQPTQQLQLPIGVKEEILPQARKRVAIFSVKLVQEASLYYANIGCLALTQFRHYSDNSLEVGLARKN